MPLMAAGQKLMAEIMEYSPLMLELPDEPLAYQEHMIEMVKKAVLFVAGTAMMKFMQKVADQQELLGRAADMIIQAFSLGIRAPAGQEGPGHPGCQKGRALCEAGGGGG